MHRGASTGRGARAAVVAGVGGAVPPRVVTNAELAERLDTTDAWIRDRTGIARRHVVDPGTATSDLAVMAGRDALSGAPHPPVDALVLATSTADHPCPATAPSVATRLGLGPVPAFDLDAVCSGFLYALHVARSMIVAGAAEAVLVIAADTFTTILDAEDRATAPLFGDGAGAVLLRSGRPDENGALLAVELGSDGTLADIIRVPDGGSRVPMTTRPPDVHFTMQGQAVYRHAVARMTAATRSVLAASGWTVHDVDRFVGHQANQRILDAVAARLALPGDRVESVVADVANTAAASIPLALARATDAGRLRSGERIALAAFGGGATWGAATLTWP